MHIVRTCLALGAAALLSGLAGSSPHASDGAAMADASVVRRTFDAPPEDARVMMRWWWFGPAVTPEGLDRDLRAMHDAGLGGVEVQPVYPLALDDDRTGTRTLSYLSPEFLAVLRHARTTAADLGLRFDLTLGSGWPFGGPSVAAADAAGALRVVSLPQRAGTRVIGLPMLEAGESYIAAYLTRGTAAPTDARAFTDLDLVRARDGHVPLPAPLAVDHTAWVFIAGRTGMMVKRPAVGGEGFVLNHYDRGALDRYLQSVGAPLLAALGTSLPYALFCDSLEVFGSDWSPGLLEAFGRRYGYDLRDHLPSLVAGDDARSRGVRHDWGQLLTELLESEFLEPLGHWARGQGSRLRVQTYGIPPARPSSARYVDVPEGEGAQWRAVTTTRWASSAAHVFGRPVASSETWTWLHSPSFAATPLDVKAEADRHLLQGITQLIGHGWPNTPAGVDWPGARFYAAAVLSDANPWWLVMPDLARYLQRTSAMLRLGSPVNDVALYLPVSEAWSAMKPGHVHLFAMLRDHVGTALVSSLLDAGYGFDVVDDQRLQVDASVEGDVLRIGKARYRVVVLPDVSVMPPQTLDLLTAFARAGGIVMATGRLPREAPGFRATSEQHAHVRRAATTLFASPSARGTHVSRGDDLGSALAARLTPDVRWQADASALGFVHRREGDTDVYFVANTSNRSIATSASFRTIAGHAQRWDPRTGERRAATPAPGANGSVTLPVTLAPYESTFYVFTSAPAAPIASPGADACDAPVRAMDLHTDWELERPGEAPRRLATASSWHAEPGLRFHSGVVTYRRVVTVDEAVGQGRCPVWLDFGEGTPRAEEPLTNGMRAWLDAPVRDGAQVFVNGQGVGAVWTAPFRVDVRRALRPGRNIVEVRVGNTALNRWVSRPQPDYRLLHLRYGKRFDPQDIDKVAPQPSGLVGRPRLVY